MAVYAVDGTDLQNIADAVKLKTGDYTPMSVHDMAMKIGLIESGGGGGESNVVYDGYFIPSDDKTVFVDITLTKPTSNFIVSVEPDDSVVSDIEKLGSNQYGFVRALIKYPYTTFVANSRATTLTGITTALRMNTYYINNVPTNTTFIQLITPTSFRVYFAAVGFLIAGHSYHITVYSI